MLSRRNLAKGGEFFWLSLPGVDKELADIYVGESHAPLGDELHPGLCLFIVPRHALPGPYFALADTLLDSGVWAEAPAIPIGPAGGYFCAVGERGQRRIPVEAHCFALEPYTIF